jgi:phage-related protein
MSLAIFTAPQSPSSAEFSPEVKVLKAEFGDGYSQPTPDGLNNVRQVVTLQWDYLEADEKQAIIGFMEARKGAEPFTYQIPGEIRALNWTCDEWSFSALPASLYNVSAKLRQSFVN